MTSTPLKVHKCRKNTKIEWVRKQPTTPGQWTKVQAYSSTLDDLQTSALPTILPLRWGHAFNSSTFCWFLELPLPAGLKLRYSLSDFTSMFSDCFVDPELDSFTSFQQFFFILYLFPLFRFYSKIRPSFFPTRSRHPRVVLLERLENCNGSTWSVSD